MTDFLSWVPLVSQTMDAIRGRIDADANLGIDPTSDDFIDTTEGGFFFDVTQATALEIGRLWDFAAVETPSAMFPQFAFGEYLDLHGEAINVPRKDASKATGTVRFNGTDTTIVQTGTEVATIQIDPAVDPSTFRTTGSGTIAGGYVDLAVEAVDAGTKGNVAAGIITVLSTPNAGVSTITNAAATSGGSDVESDEEYRDRLLVELSSATGGGTQADYRRWALAYPGVSYVSVEPLWAGAGTVRVAVADETRSPSSTTVVDALQAQIDPPVGSTTITGIQTLNSATITVGSTTGFRAATVGIPQKFYVLGQAITYTGTSPTTFTGCSGGSGSSAGGEKVIQGGSGAGLAPIGADAYIQTITALNIYVAATVTYASGYSSAGLGGTIAIGTAIAEEITAYIDSLSPGDDVVFNHVEAAIFRVTGVYDVANVTVSAAASTLLSGETLPAATIDLVSTTGFTNGVAKVNIGGQIVDYTAVGSPTTLTGGTGGTGVFAVGVGAVQVATANIGVAGLQVAKVGAVYLY